MPEGRRQARTERPPRGAAGSKAPANTRNPGRKPRTLTRRNLWVAVILLAALAAGAAVVMRVVPGSRAAAPREAPAVPVATAEVIAKDIPLRLYAVGNVEAYTTVSVKARVDGQLVAV